MLVGMPVMLLMLLGRILQLLNLLSMVSDPLYCTELCDLWSSLSPPVVPNITFPVDDGFTYTVNEGDPVTFTCSATSIPPPEITWMRNGVPFNETNTRVTLSDPTMAELVSTGGENIYFVSRNLTLDNTMDNDSGTYTCVASNRNAVDPTDVQNFELFVRGEARLSLSV